MIHLEPIWKLQRIGQAKAMHIEPVSECELCLAARMKVGELHILACSQSYSEEDKSAFDLLCEASKSDEQTP